MQHILTIPYVENQIHSLSSLPFVFSYPRRRRRLASCKAMRPVTQLLPRFSSGTFNCCATPSPYPRLHILTSQILFDTLHPPPHSCSPHTHAHRQPPCSSLLSRRSHIHIFAWWLSYNTSTSPRVDCLDHSLFFCLLSSSPL